ncbi:unnamed protein product [Cylicocyclus nassatus]|uniref:Aminopeptidase n=1 Tax=Cylicocyclus nassatus TaxID=53992 RepID=A0AA36DL37_CYLNA|nr:unnamed protein product [Cylicocyclus nassatus]
MSAKKQAVTQCTLHTVKTLVTLVVLALIVLAMLFIMNTVSTSKTRVNENDETEDHLSLAAQLHLPKAIKPLGYDLRMQTYLPSYVDFPANKNFTFEAEINIDLDVTEAVDKIVLNMRNLTIDKDKSELYVNGKKVAIAKIFVQKKLEEVGIVPTSPLQKGEQAKLKLSYTGPINKNLGGLYRTVYKESDGSQKIAAVTMMAPLDARSMVPCFDEPEFKASWNVTVIHPYGTIAISNGIEETKERIGDWVKTKFVPTPRMSSYLLALLISEFEYIQGKTNSNVLFRIWSRREAKSMTKYALQAGIKCLELYESLFNYKFPLKKQDMVALPDFTAGAMENWGMITYREKYLLYDDVLYSQDNKRLVMTVVAHELAHQWFGNLVTLKWWNDVWLNEGFATYLEYVAGNKIDNWMETEQFFIIEQLEKSMDIDSLSSSHPLSFKIDTANEVHEAFDRVSYGKGAAVLKMIAAVTGRKNFMKGVDRAEDKAEVIWRFENFPRKQLQSSFNGSLPVLLFDVVQAFEKLCLTKQERGEKLFLEEPLYIRLTEPAKAFVINAGRHGYYRQNYGKQGWKKIAEQLKANHKIFNIFTRNAIISDAFAAALLNKVSYDTIFSLLGYLKDEEDFLPWKAAIVRFEDILQYFGNEQEAKYAKQFMLKLLEPIYQKSKDLNKFESSYKQERKFLKNLLYENVINTVCSLGSRECRSNYKKLFDEEVMACKNGEKASTCVRIVAPLRRDTYCYGIVEGNDTAFKKVSKLCEVETIQIEKDRLLEALGCSRHAPSLKKLMLLSVTRRLPYVRLQDVITIFRSIKKNPVGREVMLNFVLERWNDIYDGLMPERITIGEIIELAAVGIRSQYQVEQLKSLRKHGKHANEFGNFKKAIEDSEHQVEWISRHFQNLSALFKELSQ